MTGRHHHQGWAQRHARMSIGTLSAAPSCVQHVEHVDVTTGTGFTARDRTEHRDVHGPWRECLGGRLRFFGLLGPRLMAGRSIRALLVAINLAGQLWLIANV